MSAIRSTNVIDEMFPEASGNNMMELDEVILNFENFFLDFFLYYILAFNIIILQY